MPVLFDFSDHELSIEPHLNAKLISQRANSGITGTFASGSTLNENSESLTQQASNSITNVKNELEDNSKTHSSALPVRPIASNVQVSTSGSTEIITNNAANSNNV